MDPLTSGQFGHLERSTQESTSDAVSEGDSLIEIAHANGTSFALDSLDPDELYGEIVYNSHGSRSVTMANRFEVLARPGESPTVSPQAGDILLRVALGEPGLGHVSVLCDPTLWPHLRLASTSFRAESREPGFYVPVVESGAFPHTRADPFARRILDAEGRLLPGQLLLRLHPAAIGALDRAPPYVETEGEELGLPFTDEEDLAETYREPLPIPAQDPVPFAQAPPQGSYWPVVTSHPKGREVNYKAADGSTVGTSSGRRFLANRSQGTRYHVGVDLFGNFGDPVVACEAGTVINFYPFCCGSNKTTWALFVEHDNLVINYGEVAPDSLQRAGLRTGSRVTAGQVIGYVGRNPGGSSMIHFETYTRGTRANKQWMKARTRPPALLNPTRYLLELQARGLSGSAAGRRALPSAPPAHGRPSAPTLDIERAVERNQHWGRRLGWDAHVDAIVRLLHTEPYTPGQEEFARLVYEWQRQYRLEPDGIIGPRTWRRMQSALGLQPTSSPSGETHRASYSPSLDVTGAERTALESVPGPCPDTERAGLAAWRGQAPPRDSVGHAELEMLEEPSNQHGVPAMQARQGPGVKPQLRAFPVQCAPSFFRSSSVLEIRFYDDFNAPRGDGTHNATDIKGPIGLPVVSATDGTVVREFRIGRQVFPGVAEGRKSGHLAVIVDPDGYFHHYAHLRERPIVNPGQRVTAGQPIGYLGQSGNARFSVPHLHYQVRTPLPNQAEYQTLHFSGQGLRAVNVFPKLRALALSEGWRQVNPVRYQKTAAECVAGTVATGTPPTTGQPIAEPTAPPSHAVAGATVPMTAEPRVKRRSPEYVRWLQQALNQVLGLDLVVDGILGPQTLGAIRSFQQSRGLEADGIVGPRTEAAIKAALVGLPQPPGPVSPSAVQTSPTQPTRVPTSPTPPRDVEIRHIDRVTRPNLERGVQVISQAPSFSPTCSPQDLIIAATATQEGRYDSVNMYDRGIISWGIQQWTAHSGNLQKLLHFIQVSQPEAFQRHFGSAGLGVDRGYEFTFRATRVAIERTTDNRPLRTLFRGRPSRGDYDPATIETWARIFALAGRDPVIQELQRTYARRSVDEALNRTHRLLQGRSPRNVLGFNVEAWAVFFGMYNGHHRQAYLDLQNAVNRAGGPQADPAQVANAYYAILQSSAFNYGRWASRARRLREAYARARHHAGCT